MNDLLVMGVLHRLEHLQEKPQALAYPEPMGVAPVGQRLTLHILHRQVGQALRIHTGIVETRDMGVLETGQDVALARKARLKTRLRAARAAAASVPPRA